MSTSIDAIPVSDLHFDPVNPRIPPDVEAADEQDVLDWMLQDASLVELMGSIAVNGFFPAEPLLVMPIGDRQGYYVLEGNRRLAAVKLLLEPERAPRRTSAVRATANQVSNPDELMALPCVVFNQRRQVLDYLGFRHITGIKEWEPAAKARYLRELYDEHLHDSGEDIYRRIARIIGSRSDYVMRLLGSLRLLEEIAQDEELRELGLNLEELSFSLLTLALNYRTIVEFLGLESLDQEAFDDVDREALHNLATWMYVEDPERRRTQLGESRNMKLLAAALRREAGIDSLLRGDLVEEAVQASLDVGEVVLRAIKQASSRLLSAQAMFHRMPMNDSATEALQELERLQELVDDMMLALQRRVRKGA